MSEQLLITGALIGLAGAYLLRQGWHAWRGRKGGGCAGGCGCARATQPAPAKQPALIPSEQLVLRQRPRQPAD